MSNLFKVLFVFMSFCQVVNGSSCDENLYVSCADKPTSSLRPFSDITNNSFKTPSCNKKQNKNDSRSNISKSAIRLPDKEKELFETPKKGSVLNSENDSGSKASSRISIDSSVMVDEYGEFFREYVFTLKANKILENKVETLEEKVKELKSLSYKGNLLSDDLGLCPSCKKDIYDLSVIRSNRKKTSFIDNEEGFIGEGSNLDLRSSVYSDDNVSENQNNFLQYKMLDEKIAPEPKLGFFKRVKNGFCNFFKNTFSAIKRIFVR